MANIDRLQYVIYQKCELSCHTEFLVSKIKLKCCTVCLVFRDVIKIDKCLKTGQDRIRIV